MQHTFLVHFFAIVLQKYNMKLPETSQLHVLGRKCYTHSCSLFFSLPLIVTLVATSISHFLTAATKFLPTKNVSFVFISHSSSLLLYFSLSFADLMPTFSFSTFQICGHNKFNQSLILQTTRIQKQFPHSVLFSSFLTLQFSLLHNMWVAIRFLAKITFSQLHLVCLWYGRTDAQLVARSGGVQSCDFQIFQDGQIFLAVGLRSHRPHMCLELHYNNLVIDNRAC